MSQKVRNPHRGLASRAGLVGSLARFCAKSYTLDYVAFAALSTGYLMIVFFVEPFHRMFFINNINLQYPHALEERVPVAWNIFYAGVLPILFLMIWLAVDDSTPHKANVSLLGFLTSMALTVFITDSIKNVVGRPRPDLIARCKPDPQTLENVLVNISVCTETDQHLLQDGWRSFPSGHSSFAFSGLGYLALFFAGQLHVFRPGTDLFRALLFMAPLMGAVMIAVSRCEDYRHDVYDVTCGSIIGISVAYFCYRRYYPRLDSPNCDEPLISTDSTHMEAYGSIRDDIETARSTRNLRTSGDQIAD